MCIETVLEVYSRIGHPKIKGMTWTHGTFIPDYDESCSCCKKIKKPSRSDPKTLYRHCLKKIHLKNRLLEKPTPVEIRAMKMTRTTATEYLDSEHVLLKEVAMLLLKK